MVLVAPSLLSADFSQLKNEVEKLELAHADLLHFDVMDGHFVPNITFGPMILKSLKKHTSLPFDVHLMVNNPERFIPWYAEAGADFLTIHIESTDSPDFLLKQIKSYNIKSGISLKPKTDINILSNLTEVPDLALIMSVEPGFGGQAFYSDTPDRIQQVKNLFSRTNTLVEVDGGINSETAQLCINSGADILVAGTSIFKNNSYGDNIRAIKGEPK